MLWLIGKTSGPPDSDSRRKLVLVAAQCAELALPFARDEETRAICESTIQTCYAYAAGEAELTDVRSAADAAYAATYAADDAAYARSKILAACADIVRDNYPESPL
jgi:acyl-CoA reductase-like NAD-dependent aldehyde dehydrogenase